MNLGEILGSDAWHHKANLLFAWNMALDKSNIALVEMRSQ